MTDVLTGLVVPLATYLGLKAAGTNPVVKVIGTGVSLVKVIDGYAADSAEASVRQIYRNADGSDPPIILLSSYKPSRSEFEGVFIGKDKLQKWVDTHGGTAWVQSGENSRLMYWWHPSKSFRPKKPNNPYATGLAVGHVVRGANDAK